MLKVGHPRRQARQHERSSRVRPAIVHTTPSSPLPWTRAKTVTVGGEGGQRGRGEADLLAPAKGVPRRGANKGAGDVFTY
jgi:hypothetical protein